MLLAGAQSQSDHGRMISTVLSTLPRLEQYFGYTEADPGTKFAYEIADDEVFLSYRDRNH